jgi:putative SOS response-associated peptidase YedK
LPISYNIAPSHEVLAIRLNSETKATLSRSLAVGVSSVLGKDKKIDFKTINAGLGG